MPGLCFRDVSFAYSDQPVLDGIDLEVKHREIVCLMGPSGCGKTTVLRLAAGLEPIRSGEISINGEVVSGDGKNIAPEYRGVGLVFQNFALFPHMTVAGNIGFGLRHDRSSDREEKVRAMLDRVGLPDKYDKYPHMLSGGEQQRIALARALAPEPAVLMLDEPFAGLDIRLRERVREQALTLLKDIGATVLVVTHDAEEAMYMGDRLAVLQERRIIQTGTPAELYNRPKSAFVARFLGDVNWMHGYIRRGVVEAPIGVFPAESGNDGERVDVLVRPEDLRLSRQETGGATDAIVVEQRLLGHTSLVTLRLNEGAELRARVMGQDLPKPGTVVSIECADESVLVYPCERGSSFGATVSGYLTRDRWANRSEVGNTRPAMDDQ